MACRTLKVGIICYFRHGLDSKTKEDSGVQKMLHVNRLQHGWQILPEKFFRAALFLLYSTIEEEHWQG